jgi:hypothetical protein
VARRRDEEFGVSGSHRSAVGRVRGSATLLTPAARKQGEDRRRPGISRGHYSAGRRPRPRTPRSIERSLLPISRKPTSAATKPARWRTGSTGTASMICVLDGTLDRPTHRAHDPGMPSDRLARCDENEECVQAERPEGRPGEEEEPTGFTSNSGALRRSPGIARDGGDDDAWRVRIVLPRARVMSDAAPAVESPATHSAARA